MKMGWCPGAIYRSIPSIGIGMRPTLQNLVFLHQPPHLHRHPRLHRRQPPHQRPLLSPNRRLPRHPRRRRLRLRRPHRLRLPMYRHWPRTPTRSLRSRLQRSHRLRHRHPALPCQPLLQDQHRRHRRFRRRPSRPRYRGIFIRRQPRMRLRLPLSQIIRHRH